jgi:hypothetical protein
MTKQIQIEYLCPKQDQNCAFIEYKPVMLSHTSACSVSDLIFICAYRDIKKQLDKDSLNYQTEKYSQNRRARAMNE